MGNPLRAINRVRSLQREAKRLANERAARAAALTTVRPSTDAAATATPAAPDPADYFNDPQGFCETWLRVRLGKDLVPFRLWSKQGELAKAIALFRRVACRSGHKVGKSALAAALAIWWACTRPNARVILTAPTGRQIKKAVWYEVRRFWQNSPELQKIMPAPGLDPETGVRWADGRELFGFSAENADAVSGPGGPEVLVIIDEGSGVSLEVWEALQGIRAGGGKVLALGNPTQTTGWFFDAFHEKRDGWSLHQIKSTETPNFIEGRMVVPGLADRDFEEEIRNDYGIDSPAYAVRVNGDFPANVANAVIGLGLIESARKAWDGDLFEGNTTDLGVDVARFGDDDSSVSARIGFSLFTPAWFEKERGVKAVVNGYDSVKVANLCVQCLGALPPKPNSDHRIRIKIDVTGGYGEPVAAALRALQDRGELDPTIEIYEVNYSSSSSDDTKFPVLRDELWFGARPWFKDGGALYPDGKCEAELMAATYAPDAKGRNKVESKKDIKKRLGRSPDRADSALLAIYEPPPPDDLSIGYSSGYDRRF